MSDTSIRLDTNNLRGVAHPLRVRLLGLLRQDGPSTATRLAERTGQSTGATSYHLRQLASYGFVVEDTSQAPGRQRWWRAAHLSTTVEAADARGNLEATEAYMRSVAVVYADRMNSWIAELSTLPNSWDNGVTLSDYRLRLTPAESTALLAELEAVVQAYRQDEPAPQASPPDARAPEAMPPTAMPPTAMPPKDAARVILQIQLMPFLREG